eukprot:SAG31_NODE_25315_length_463_cov_1.950549_2_plen_53_part_01
MLSDCSGCPELGAAQECSWSYGTTENIVWEGTSDAPVTLAAGQYVMTLTAVNT